MMAAKVKRLTCPSCEGKVRVTATSLTLTCPHCDSKLQNGGSKLIDVTPVIAVTPRSDPPRIVEFRIDIPKIPPGMIACKLCNRATAWVDIVEGYKVYPPKLTQVTSRTVHTPDGHTFDEPVYAMVAKRMFGNFCRACMGAEDMRETVRTNPNPPNPLSRRPTDQVYSGPSERRVYPRPVAYPDEAEFTIEPDPIKAAIRDEQSRQRVAAGLTILRAMARPNKAKLVKKG